MSVMEIIALIELLAIVTLWVITNRLEKLLDEMIEECERSQEIARKAIDKREEAWRAFNRSEAMKEWKD